MTKAERIVEAAIGIAIAVHRDLGPGLLESAYQRIVRDELVAAGFDVHVEVNVPLKYKGRNYANSFRVDLLIDRQVVVEIKSTERPAKVHSSQVLTYLRCLGLRHGLLLNFGMERAIEGIDRVINYRTGRETQVEPPDLDALLPRTP